ELTAAARSARHVNVFTGAGMSADSGLDTFRDAQTGIWSRVDPQAMASISSWARDPEPMLAWYLWRAALCREAEPNAGHTAIGEWGRRGDVALEVTTQNIDDLHERGGATTVHHLHGSLFAYRCSICGKPARTPELPREQVERVTPPQCSLCGNPVRPDVVWFGESLPQKEWAAAEEAVRRADLVVVVGTSGVVWPAAGLPEIAASRGVPIVEVSPAATELTRLATWSLRTTAAVGLPALVEALEG
ncbi:MAG TPA: NAD-dependent deacylase, partial [Candidatus Corynebacterium gallistercoris]|nr:NAD-dependent deacylase [Candidatus Corynebacterium gallistercoris]